LEVVLTKDVGVQRVADQRVRAAINQRAVHQRARQCELRRVAGPITGQCRIAAQAIIITVTCLARFPRDGVVVELDVEIARVDVRTLRQDHLEAVVDGQLRENTNVDVVDAENIPSTKSVSAVAHQTRPRAAGVHVCEERRDDRTEAAVGDGCRRVSTQGVIEGDVAVVVDVGLRVVRGIDVSREAQSDLTGGPVVIGGECRCEQARIVDCAGVGPR